MSVTNFPRHNLFCTKKLPELSIEENRHMLVIEKTQEKWVWEVSSQTLFHRFPYVKDEEW